MSIVVGYDGSELAEQALDFAVQEARLRGLPLRVVTTWDAPSVDLGMATGVTVDPHMIDAVTERAKRISADAADKLGESGVEVTAETLPGPAAAALIDISHDADLLVLGSHGRRALGEIMLGSTSQQVATHATCPTVIVRTAETPNHRVAVAIDGSQPGMHALDFAFDEASRRGWALRVIHAWDVNVIGFDVEDSTYPPGGIIDDVKEAETRLSAEILAGHGGDYPDVEVEVKVERGHADKVVLDNCDGVDLLVVGSRGHGGFTSLLLGSVSHKVMHHALCSVAIVH